MLRSVAVVSALVLTVLSLTACQNGGMNASPYAIDYLELENIDYRTGWASEVAVTPGSKVTQADLLGDVIVTLEQPSNIATAFNAKTGELIWKATVGEKTEPVYGPYRYENRICINTDRQMWCFNAKTGERMMIGNLRAIVKAQPAMVERLAIFGGADGRVFAFDVTTAQKIWEYQLAAATVTKPLAVGSGNAFVVDSGGVYALLHAVTGELLWRGRTFGSVVADPTSDSIRIYIPSTDRTLYAIDRTSGRDRWNPYRAEVPLTQSPLAGARDVFLPLPGKGLVDLRAGDGHQNWESDLQVQPIALLGPTLLARDSKVVYTLNAGTGEITGQAKAQGNADRYGVPLSRNITRSFLDVAGQ